MGIYSTSQFLGVATGMSSGWIIENYGVQAIFIMNILVATIWFLIAITMREPKYVSSLRIIINSDKVVSPDLEDKIRSQPGVSEVMVIPNEYSAYVKTDIKLTSRYDLEKIIKEF
jgi:hypothetical protein